MFTAANGWIDFRRMEDRVLYNITQDTSSHKYIHELARDSTRGHIEAALAGRWNGGWVPYGYRVQYRESIIGSRHKQKPDKLVVFEPEAEIVRWIFRTYSDTDTPLRGLVTELYRRGVRAPRGAARWNTRALRLMLNNPVCLGEMAWNRNPQGKLFGVFNCQVVPVSPSNGDRRNDPEQWIRRADRHEALIDQATFARVQDKLLANRSRKSTRRDRPFALSGLLLCGHCKKAMIGRTFLTQRGNKTYRYRWYLCGTYNQYGKEARDFNGVRETALLRCIVDKLASRLEEEFLCPENVEKLKDEIRHQAAAQQQNKPGTAQKLQKQIDSLTRMITRATELLLTEEHQGVSDELRKRLVQKKEEQARLLRQLALLEKSAEQAQADLEQTIAQAGAYIGRMREALDLAQPLELAAILREMVSSIELWFDHEAAANGTRCHFAKGMIYLRNDVSFIPSHSETSSARDS
jgi:hypothetical protein